jgi:hypothetical protein
MTLRARRVLLPLLLALSGCADADFTENDSGKTVEVNQGSGFTVALPRMTAGPRPAPEVKGALIRPLERRVDASTNQEIFPFLAEGVGDAVIRIPPTDPAAADFVIQVHVLPSAKSAPGSPSGGPKPPGSY